jgi:DNA-binding CsgD family transcriptional regulator
LALAALLAVWTLGISLYLVWMRRPTSSRRDPDAVQFIAFNQGSLRMQPQHHDATANTVFLYERADDDSPQLEIPIRPVLDRITKQCESLRLAYRLSDREAEVMELIVRGDTVARIAEKLNVSENTVRTHAKRIYTKLDVHSKQELHDLVQRFQPVDI